MRIRSILAALAAPALIAGAVLATTAGPALADPGGGNGTIVVMQGPGHCLVLNATETALIAGDNGHITFNPNGFTNAKCSATTTPPAGGQAVNLNNFECAWQQPDGTEIAITTDSHETISASGNITLTCFGLWDGRS